ncbi:Protein activity of BC1 complex kinase 7, chloroplastic [Vitis vinifera]|uniref:Protein activity of BC1 complex kinase 7, chloroplastic n=1 Tax=Vitis vinifera TaxID=29760 RepID=A0A438EEY5_VITVI|nr:Protein activity of BC1 complex kinase 7, chloroplastic [Vitis vinifera]
MAAILASHSCYCRNVELMNQGRAVENLGFSSSISSQNFSKFERPTCHLPMADKSFRFQVEMRKSESPVSLASIVKRDTATALVKAQKSKESRDLPPMEELKVLPSDEENRSRKTASWLRERVLQLGPTFIKFGQLSSTRSDLFPREFVDELAKLQDRVPAFSSKKARDLIESELGASIEILFKEFEDQPIAAASLGQVHRAVLHNGEKVVVKVQRPGLKKLFDIDLRNLKLIAEYFQRSETFSGATRDWIGIYEECATLLYQEIDYMNEGKNADRFRRDFRNVKWVRVPLVFWDYTATKVLTLEYVPGIKINRRDMLDAQGFNRSRISSHAIEAYLIQVMQSLTDLEALQPTGDLSSVRRSVQFFLDNLLSQTPDQPQTLAAIGEDLFAIATDQPIRFPSTITFVLKAFSTLEGIGYSLDPDFSFVKIAAPYAQELLDIRQQQRTGPQFVQEIRKQADDVFYSLPFPLQFLLKIDARTYTMSMPYSVQRIEEFVKQLESGDLKLRVRVLESERAARKATILQMATMYTVLGGTLLSLGVTLSNQGSQVIANGSYVGAGVFLVLFIRSMQRVKRLDKFEKMI